MLGKSVSICVIFHAQETNMVELWIEYVTTLSREP